MLESRGILLEDVSGFRRQLRTIGSIRDLVLSLEAARHNGCRARVAFQDVHRAFDALPHDALLRRR